MGKIIFVIAHTTRNDQFLKTTYISMINNTQISFQNEAKQNDQQQRLFNVCGKPWGQQCPVKCIY